MMLRKNVFLNIICNFFLFLNFLLFSLCFLYSFGFLYIARASLRAKGSSSDFLSLFQIYSLSSYGCHIVTVIG